ncbi:MAG: 3-hydroxyacyl-CoA dehydrogenase, partial [Proteobacteria bacterium]|nr:3-hydroxyacyl-CoA dehydrogenase [Pseudomonadota bacterium]
MLNYSVDSDGIVTLEWDYPGKPQNILNPDSMGAFADAVRQALADPVVKGILVASAKKDFIAGGDLEKLLEGGDGQALFDGFMSWHQVLRAMETGGKPIA